MKKGYFVISLDYELMWGVRDSQTKESYGKNILGYPALTMGGQVRLCSFLDKEYKIGGYLLVFSFVIFIKNVISSKLYQHSLSLTKFGYNPVRKVSQKTLSLFIFIDIGM